MPVAYVKVAGLDSDFDELEAGTVRDLKAAILTAKSSRLTGYTPADLKVYYVGSEPPDSDALSGKALPVYTEIPTETPHYVIVPAASLSVLSKPSGNLPSVILPGSHETAPTVDLGPITGTLSQDSQLRRMLNVKYEPPPPPVAVPEVILPTLKAPETFRSKFGEHVANTVTPGFFATREAETKAPEFKVGSINTTLLNQIRLNLDVLELPPRLNPIEYELPIPSGDGVHYRVGAGIAELADARGLTFPVEKPADAPTRTGIDHAALLGGAPVQAALQRMRSAPVKYDIASKELEDTRLSLVWIANGTASTGESFEGHRLEDVEEYVRTHPHCFESTRIHSLHKFYLDLDGYAPQSTTKSEFASLATTIGQRLYMLVSDTAVLMTSCKYQATSYRVGPLGTNLKRTGNKLSFRIIFKRIYGDRESMDLWVVREIVPVLKHILQDICKVTHEDDADKLEIPASGNPYIVVDRWVYHIGDRMRMIWSTKEHESRPLVPFLDEPAFLDTLLCYIPPGSTRLPTYHQIRGDTRVPFWNQRS